MSWCGIRARDGWEWHHRREISAAFWRISKKRQQKNGWPYDMDVMTTYDTACQEIRAKQPKLKSGYARVFTGGRLTYSAGEQP